MSEQFPLYPELPEGGAEEAVKLIESFKTQLKKAADNVISDLYVDILPYIETDAWTNFRNVLMDGFSNYGNRKIQSDYDFAKIRKAIFTEFHDEIIEDLNQDMVEEIASLKKDIERLSELNRYRS